MGLHDTYHVFLRARLFAKRSHDIGIFVLIPHLRTFSRMSRPKSEMQGENLRSATSVEYQLPIRPGRDFSRNRERHRPKTSRQILCRCQKATRGLKGSINGAEIKTWDNLLVEVDGMKLLFHKTQIPVVPTT